MTTHGFRYHAIMGLRAEVLNIRAEAPDGTYVGQASVAPTEFSDPQLGDGNPVLSLNTNKTITVGSGETVGKIILVLNTVDQQSSYDALATYEIGGTSGEEFPDGGEIEVTSFEVQFNDI